MHMKHKPELVKPAQGDAVVVTLKTAPKEGPMSYQQGFASAGSL